MANVPVWMTCLIGIGVVFAGLLLLIIICSIMGAILKNSGKVNNTAESDITTSGNTDESLDSAERGKLVAAASAAIAESLGKEVNAIRIVSFRKI